MYAEEDGHQDFFFDWCFVIMLLFPHRFSLCLYFSLFFCISQLPFTGGPIPSRQSRSLLLSFAYFVYSLFVSFSLIFFFVVSSFLRSMEQSGYKSCYLFSLSLNHITCIGYF